MPQNFVKLYTGGPISVLAVLSALASFNIIPIIKDPNESARLAGFGCLSDLQTVWVHPDEFKKAEEVLSKIDF